MTDPTADRLPVPGRWAVAILGAVALVAIIAGATITALGYDATPTWLLATTATGGVAGVLVPSEGL